MNIDINKILSHIEKNGVSSAMAILFCVYILYKQQGIEKENVNQGKVDVEIKSDIKQLKEADKDVNKEIDKIWDLWDNKAVPEMTNFKSETESDIKVLESKVHELERHH